MKIIFGKMAQERENILGFNCSTQKLESSNNIENKVFAWKCELKNVKIGDFAIVENLDSYALVEVVGIADIDESSCGLICGVKKITKKTLAKIDRKTLDALSNGEKVDLDVALGKKKAKTTKK